MMIEYVTEAIGNSCEKLETGSGLRFFDEGEVILHLLGRGVRFDTRQDEQFLRDLLEPYGISLSETGEVEVSCAEQDARTVFGKYVLAMKSIVQWERDQECVAAK